MKRPTQLGHSILGLALLACLAVFVSPARAVNNFVPPIQAQVPPAVNGDTTSATPKIAIAIGHSGSMIENIATGRADFVSADVAAVPTSGCIGSSCVCGGGATTSTYGAAPFLDLPAHFQLYCRDSSLTTAEDGSGPLQPDIRNTNTFQASAYAGQDYSDYMATLLPDIDFSAATGGSGCFTTKCSEGTTPDGGLAFELVGTTYQLGVDFDRPDAAGLECLANGTSCTASTTPPGDGVSDRSVYPWDLFPSPGAYVTGYNPTFYTPAPWVPPAYGFPTPKDFAAFPYVDGQYGFTSAIRLKDPGSTPTAWRNSKIRAAVCAVEGFVGLDLTRAASPSLFDCDFDDLGSSYDSFFLSDILGKADLAVFKTNQRAPGLYPPLHAAPPVNPGDPPTVNYAANRERVDLRVKDFYGAGSTTPGGVSFGCNASGDEACDRSVALLQPDVYRADSGGGLADNFNDCLGLDRSTSVTGGYGFNGSAITQDDADLTNLFNSPAAMGYPGGVMSISGILRDACGSNGTCPGASTSLPNNVIASGVFLDDSNDCGSSNALVIVTDSPDSCADSTCTASTGDRLVGYPDTPVQPFSLTSSGKSNCPDAIAASMRASTTEAKTYIVGLDADWDTTTKQSMSKIAAAGGTNAYYSARSFDDVRNALRAIYNDVKFSADAVIPTGVFALGIARSDATGLKDVVIDARYRPAHWQGYLFAREITQSGSPLAFWEAGDLLSKRDVSTSGGARSAFTAMDLNCDGKIAGSDERIVFSTTNLDLTTPGGNYATQAACTGTPRTSLKHVHHSGAPFFLDDVVDGANLWTDRDGNAVSLIGYTLGLKPSQLSTLSGAVAPATGYRDRDFDGDGSVESVWPLYDIANSSPVIVGPSLSIQANDADADGDGLTDFEEYQAKVRDRPRLSYVGTNGGSLHGFNVDGSSAIQVGGTAVNAEGAKAGGEVFVMWPHEFLNRLKRYASGTYGQASLVGGNPTHEDGLDLTARIFDAKVFPNSEGAPLFGWRTVLVIGARNGGHVYLALDVTDPTETMAIEDLDSTGAPVAYTFPTLLWEFSEFRDDGHDALGNPLQSDTTQCDDVANPSGRSLSQNANCEDNGQDDDWSDRVGLTWSYPWVSRSRTSAGTPVIYLASGPGTIEPGSDPGNPTASTATRGDGFLVGIDVSSGSLIDLDSSGSNGQPYKVADTAFGNAGPICVNDSDPTTCTVGTKVAPFRSSLVGADITSGDDSTYNGQRADVFYWGDLGGRLWRARFTGTSSDNVETKVVFFPKSDVTSVDTVHPIVSRPSLTASKVQTLLGSAPPLLVVFGDGSLDFGSADVAEGVYPVDEIASDEKFRVFSIVDDASFGSTQYLDFDDEDNCQAGTLATTTSSADSPTSPNSGGDLDNRTLASSTYPPIVDPQFPASGTHPPTTASGGRTGGYYQCLANNFGGSAIPDATGSERMLGSPFILGGGVVVETFRPVTGVSNVCYNVGTGSILTFDYDTGGLINFTLRGGASQQGAGKYYTAPANPVAVANTPGLKPVGSPPAGFPPDFLRYHLITGGEPPAPQIPIETVYWREPF